MTMRPETNAMRTAPARIRSGVVWCGVISMLLVGCAHQPNPASPASTGGAAASDATLRASADRAVLDAAAFDAALQRGPSARPAAVAPLATAVTEPARAAPAPARASVQFQAGSTRLAAEQAAAIERLAHGAKRGARWQVTVRTDGTGTARANPRLARARVEHVVEQLVRFGVARDAIKVINAPPRGAAPNAAASAASNAAGRVAQTGQVDIDVLGS